MAAGSLASTLAFTASLCALQWWDARNRVEGVVQAAEVTVRSSPEAGSTEVFTVHEGTKVGIDQQTRGWVEIVLSVGKTGWVPPETVERI